MSKRIIKGHFNTLGDLLIDDLPGDPHILNFFDDLETDVMKMVEQVTELVAALSGIARVAIPTNFSGCENCEARNNLLGGIIMSAKETLAKVAD